MQTLTRQQVRQIDRLAIEELGIPGIVLMENAARNAAGVALDTIEGQLQLTATDARIAILCGGGNNGGDGYAIARHLHNHGVEIALFAATAPDELAGDALTNFAICDRMGLPLQLVTDEAAIEEAAAQWGKCHVIIDALLGTGFAGTAVRHPLAQVIARCNQVRQDRGVLVLAVDVPSGLDCDTGVAALPTIEADLTVTFVAVKAGFVTESARPHVGEIHIADIGAPPELMVQVRGGE